MNNKAPDTAKQIAAELGGLTPQEAAVVLAQAQILILGTADGKVQYSKVADGDQLNPLLLRRPKHMDLLDRRPDILRFLNSLDRPYSINALVDLCQKEFGPTRGLSETNLDRCIKRRKSTVRRQRRKSS